MLKRTKKVENVNKIKKNRVIGVIILLILLGGVVFLGYSYVKVQNELKALKDPMAVEQLAKKQLKSILDSVSKHMILPENEEPSFATITDIEALKAEQPFYDGAENGDQILIYKGAQMGIVYSPTKDRIVKVGPVFFQEDGFVSEKEDGNKNGLDSKSLSGLDSDR